MQSPPTLPSPKNMERAPRPSLALIRAGQLRLALFTIHVHLHTAKNYTIGQSQC